MQDWFLLKELTWRNALPYLQRHQNPPPFLQALPDIVTLQRWLSERAQTLAIQPEPERIEPTSQTEVAETDAGAEPRQQAQGQDFINDNPSYTPEQLAEIDVNAALDDVPHKTPEPQEQEQKRVEQAIDPSEVTEVEPNAVQGSPSTLEEAPDEEVHVETPEQKGLAPRLVTPQRDFQTEPPSPPRDTPEPESDNGSGGVFFEGSMDGSVVLETNNRDSSSKQEDSCPAKRPPGEDENFSKQEEIPSEIGFVEIEASIPSDFEETATPTWLVPPSQVVSLSTASIVASGNDGPVLPSLSIPHEINRETSSQKKRKTTRSRKPKSEKEQKKPYQPRKSLSEREIIEAINPHKSTLNDILSTLTFLSIPSALVVGVVIYWIKHPSQPANFKARLSTKSKAKPVAQTTRTQKQNALESNRNAKPEHGLFPSSILDKNKRKKIDQLKSHFTGEEIILSLIDELEIIDPLIRQMSLHQPGSSLYRDSKPEAIQHLLKKYDSTKSESENEVLFIGSLGKEQRYSTLKPGEKQKLLEHYQKDLLKIHTESVLSVVESFHWLNLLCGYPSADLKKIICTPKASELLIHPSWHSKHISRLMYSGHLDKDKKKAFKKHYLFAPFWQLKSKKIIETSPSLIPVIYEKNIAKLVIFDNSLVPIKSFDPQLLKVYTAIKVLNSRLEWEKASFVILASNLKWETTSIEGQPKRTQKIYKNLILKAILPDKSTAILVFDNGRIVAPGAMHTPQLVKSLDEPCLLMKTQKATNLCMEYTNKHSGNSKHLDMAMFILYTHPGIGIPVFTPGGSPHESMESSLSIDQAAIPDEWLLGINQLQLLVLPMQALKRLDHFSADEFNHMYGIVLEAFNEFTGSTAVNMFQICGYIPNPTLQRLCFDTHKNKQNKPKPSTIEAIARRYMNGLPHSYDGLTGENCRYLPSVEVAATETGFQMDIKPVAQLIRNGIPQELIIDVDQSEETVTTLRDMPVLGVNPNRIIRSITATGTSGRQTGRTFVSYTYQFENDKTMIIPDPAYSTATYTINFEDAEDVVLYTFYKGKLLPEAP